MSPPAEAMRPQSCRFSWPLYGALVALAFLVNYPGRLDSDTLDMITMGKYPAFLYDWHAPLLTWLYSIFTPVLGQPAGALLMQGLLMFVYFAVLPVRQDNRPVLTGAIAVASGILVAALIAVAGQVVKDCVLVGAVLCLLAVLDLGGNSPGAGKWLAWKMALLVMIVCLRPSNFLLLATAGTIYAVFVFGAGRKFLRVLLLIFVASAAALPVTGYINHDVLGARRAAAEDSLIIFDVAGISSDLRQNLFAELGGWPADRLPAPWECYQPSRWDNFKWGPCMEYTAQFDKAMSRPGAPSSDFRWWLGIVLRHPVSYVKHRIAYTFELLRGDRTIVGWRLPYATNTPMHLDMISGAQDGGKDLGGGTHGIDMTQQVQMWKPTIAYTPFGWVAARIFARTSSAPVGLVLCLAALWWNWRNRRRHQGFDPASVAAGAIGLGNIVMFAVFGSASDGRYTTVTLVCGLVALLRTIPTLPFPAMQYKAWLPERFRLRRTDC